MFPLSIQQSYSDTQLLNRVTPLPLPTSVIKRKRPTQKIFQEDEMQSFRDQDIVSTIVDI